MLINKYLDASFNKKFYLNNRGRGERDFTYIYDVVDIIIKLRNKSIKKNEMFIFAEIVPPNYKQY